MIIAGIEFERLRWDEWRSADGRLVLRLLMKDDTTKYPWRVVVDGRAWHRKYSTPFVAVVRTLERMKENAQHQEHELRQAAGPGLLNVQR